MGRQPAGLEMKASFNLLPHIPINARSTLDQLTAGLQSVRDGLPELIKNCKDQYVRLGIHDRADCQIVVAASTARRTLLVIDFAGAPLENFEGWTTWSNPDAGRREVSDQIEAGHGNGGKAFMVRGATDLAFMESCYQGVRTRMGFQNKPDTARYLPGFGVEWGVEIREMPESKPLDRLSTLLAGVDMSPSDLPEGAQRILAERQAFTGVFLRQVKDWSARRRRSTINRITDELTEVVSSHGQAAATVATCDVWIIVDGALANDGQPLRPSPIAPYPGFEEPSVYEIPDQLPDPQSGELVNVIEEETGDRTLILRTSERQLQISAGSKGKNVIRVWNNRNNVALWSMSSLGHMPATASYIYGDLRCPSLHGEHIAGADRLHLAPTPLTRALEAWTAVCVGQLADELHAAMLTKTKPKDREKARTALNQIRNLMREFLQPKDQGNDFDDEFPGGTTGREGTGKAIARRAVVYGKRIDRIELEPAMRRFAWPPAPRFRCSSNVMKNRRVAPISPFALPVLCCDVQKN